MTTTNAQRDKTWDVTVLEHLTSHVQAEQTIMDDYARAVRTVQEPDVQYLLDLIVDDEVRHHRMMEEMVHALKGMMHWQHVSPAVPGRTHGALSPEVRQLVERFLKVERTDRRELEDLRHKLRPVADTTLWTLLIDLMALDTEKHIRILESLAARGSD